MAEFQGNSHRSISKYTLVKTNPGSYDKKTYLLFAYKQVKEITTSMFVGVVLFTPSVFSVLK